MCVCLSLQPLGWAHSLRRFLGSFFELELKPTETTTRMVEKQGRMTEGNRKLKEVGNYRFLRGNKGDKRSSTQKCLKYKSAKAILLVLEHKDTPLHWLQIFLKTLKSTLGPIAYLLAWETKHMCKQHTFIGNIHCNILYNYKNGVQEHDWTLRQFVNVM